MNSDSNTFSSILGLHVDIRLIWMDVDHAVSSAEAWLGASGRGGLCHVTLAPSPSVSSLRKADLEGSERR